MTIERKNERKFYKNLRVWEKADQLAYDVYQVTKKFPKEELYGLTSQLRRAALSIPTNIVEGKGRQNSGERKHFLNIALGSLSEVEYLMEFSAKLGYLSYSDLKCLDQVRSQVGGMLWKLYQHY